LDRAPWHEFHRKFIEYSFLCHSPFKTGDYAIFGKTETPSATSCKTSFLPLFFFTKRKAPTSPEVGAFPAGSTRCLCVPKSLRFVTHPDCARYRFCCHSPPMSFRPKRSGAEESVPPPCHSDRSAAERRNPFLPQESNPSPTATQQFSIVNSQLSMPLHFF